MSTENKLIIPGLAFGLVAPYVLSTYGLTTLVSILYYGLMAFSLGFLVRNVGLISMAQTSFFGLAGYMVGIFGVKMGLPFPIPPLIGIVIAIASGLVFGMIALRTYAISFLMITLAIGQLCWSLAQQWIAVFGGFNGIQGIRAPVIAGIDFSQPAVFYYTLFIVFVAAVYFLRRLVESPFGLALRGIKENPDRMAALGYSVFQLRQAAFVIAAGIAALGGVFSVYFTGVITPSVLSIDRAIWTLLIVILGGANYFWGPLFGTMCAVVLDVVISSLTPRYNTVIGAIFLLIVLYATDKGLFKVMDLVPKSWRRKPDAGTDPT
ncbi:MAG: branched-chain amino acid ABC transporter permease [Planctomycetota bacterium]|jgi:branched-chain amino acid transport system permease protein|nr:branched-chain amino acid ABC transporter permease [Planctomycetota bacterium]